MPKQIKSIHTFALTALLMVLFPMQVFAANNEITIDKALEQFYSRNYDILINRYEIDKSQADIVGAKLFPNPSFTFNQTGIKTSNFPGAGDNTQMQMRLDQLVELGGKRGLRTKVAQETMEAVQLSHKDNIRLLLRGFFTLFYNFKLDMLNFEQANEELKRFDRILDIAEKRFSAGQLSLVDYTKIRYTRVDLENNLTTLENQIKNDGELLSLLVGSETPLKPSIQARDSFAEYNVDDLISTASENRYDLLALKKLLKSAEYNTALTKAGRIPDVTFGAEYDTYTRQNTPGLGLGFNLNIPIFNRKQGELARRSAEYRQLEVQIDKQKRQIMADVRQAFNNFTASLTVLGTYKSRKNDIVLLLDRSEKAFSLGGVTTLDLLDTQKIYREFMTKFNQSLIQSNLNAELLKVVTGEIK